nr:cell division protein ZapE [Azomonas macrocytogenes]
MLSARDFRADSAQQAAIEALAQWLGSWLRGRRTLLRVPAAGVYLWGGVGRGKSFVMDAFFSAIPLPAKRRVHFHAFLREVQVRLREISGQPDPLALVARQIAAQTRILCFDEFHVHDIGDAVLLGRILKMLVEHDVGLVMTSNYAPSGLCPNPLYRDRFKSAIALLEKRFNVLHVDGGEDYRQRPDIGQSWGHFRALRSTEDKDWLGRQSGLHAAAVQDVVIQVNHRPLRVRAHDAASAWLDFDELCRGPRSSADFLWLCQRFERLAIGVVPRLDGESIDVQQRFLNFIDIVYDSGIHLLLLGETHLDELLSDGAHTDFSRTHSRLQQLRITDELSGEA